MEIELKPQQEGTEQAEAIIDPATIKQQYQELQQEQAAQLTPEQMEEQREEQVRVMDKELPFLRQLKEFNELQIAVKKSEITLAELDVRMGLASANQIRGLVGKSLEIESMRIGNEWSRMSLEQQDLRKRAMEELETLKKMQEEQAAKESSPETK